MVTLIAPGRWSFRLPWRFIKAISTTRGLVRKNNNWDVEMGIEQCEKHSNLWLFL
jgi:hypothetical protein